MHKCPERFLEDGKYLHVSSIIYLLIKPLINVSVHPSSHGVTNVTFGSMLMTQSYPPYAIGNCHSLNLPINTYLGPSISPTQFLSLFSGLCKRMCIYNANPNDRAVGPSAYPMPCSISYNDPCYGILNVPWDIVLKSRFAWVSLLPF